MLRRILFLLLACFLAWHFGPLLLDGLISSGPIFRELITIFTPINFTGRGLTFYLQFVVAVAIFALLIKAASLFLGFALPTSQRYGTTKIMRYTQCLGAELLIMHTNFFLITLSVTLITNGWQEADAYAYVQTIQDLWFFLLPGAVTLYVLTNGLVKRWLVVVYTSFLLEFLEPGHFGEGGSARFAGLIEEWALRDDLSARKRGDALFMGRSLYNPTLHLAIKDNRHMITIAGSRGGKGATAIIPNLLVWQGSALVIDPKGANALSTAKQRQSMGQKIYVIDPFEVLGEEFYEKLNKKGPDTFNPLNGLDVDSLTIREDLGVLADALVVADTTHRDPHWDDGAKTIISGLVAHLISSPEYEKNRSLPVLRDFMALSPSEQDGLWASMSLNRKAGAWARDAASRVIRGIHTDEIQNILSNVDKHTEWLGSEGIQKVLSGPLEAGKSKSIFAELRERPTTIYLVVPPKFLDIHRRFLRLFINLALNEMSRSGKLDTKVLMILDEFQQLGKMPEIVKAYRLLAGYNFLIWIFAQDWAGMIELYGNDANTFLSSSRAIQIFSLNDAQSLELISKQIGTRYRSGLVSANGLQAPSLRTPDEVAKETSLWSKKQYILRAGAAPLVLERVNYYEDQHGLLAKLTPRNRFWQEDSIYTHSTLNNPIANIRQRFLRRLYPFKDLYDMDPDYK